MILVEHIYKKRGVKKETGTDNFILTNRNGNYLFKSGTVRSKYEGLFYFKDLEMFRILEDIELTDFKEIKNLRNKFFSVERDVVVGKENDSGKDNQKITESFIMPAKSTSLIYRLSRKYEAVFHFDIKKSYDSRIWGRDYKVYYEKGIAVIEFTKKTDSREDNSPGKEEYKIFVAIRSDNPDYEIIGEWVERDYSRDKERKSKPFTRYVYKAMKINSKDFVVAFSDNKKSAIDECNKIFENIDNVVKKNGKQFYGIIDNELSSLPKELNRGDDELFFSYISAISSMHDLFINDKKTKGKSGIFAGLPWFFQFWARDTAISLGEVPIELSKIKKILFDMLDTITEKGRVRNIYSGEKDAPDNTADGTGWVFFRLYELFKDGKLDDKEIEKVKKALIFSILCHKKIMTTECLIPNKALETWMDTSYMDDDREGIRIEIQALWLCMLKFAYEITGDAKYGMIEMSVKKAVKEKFWNGKILADGINDDTIRPNIFLAAYIYPDVLERREWIECFKNIKKNIWLSWGGYSTIDKKSKLFCDNYSGEDNRSYHRGDSWFFLNNIAAIVLYRLDKFTFDDEYKKIIESGSEEILWKGVIGHSGEVSSASGLKSEGCLIQAWSNSTFIELIKLIYSND